MQDKISEQSLFVDRAGQHGCFLLFEEYRACGTVSETQDDGSNLTVRADALELIKGLTLRLFVDVRVTLTNCTPQTSIGGSIQLMVSGVMHQKNCDEERLFTQALLLA